LIIFSVLPEVTSAISQSVGIQRGVDLFVYIGIVILFYSMFRMYVEIDKLKENITNLTRELAKERAKKPKK
jgi:small membrane protein